jgi:maleylacetate reductase
MKPFRYQALPGRVVFGAGAARTELAAEVDRLGLRRVLLIASTRGYDLAAGLAAPLGRRLVATFTDVRPHVPVEVARAAIGTAADWDADGLLCVGGGSATGTAKAVALELRLPLVAVPTTYAGSEQTTVWGLTERGRKVTGRSPDVLPRAVVYDPELTVGLPPEVTAPSGMNALAHAVEARYAAGANPVTDLYADAAVRSLARCLPDAVDDGTDLDARSGALYGAFLAGAAFGAAGGGLHHRVCHLLGGAFHLPHAETHAVLLPYTVAFHERAQPGVLAPVAAALHAPGAAAGLRALAERIGAPTALRDIGLRESEVDAAVKLLLEQDYPGTPRPVDEGVLRQLLAAALAGRPPTGGRDGRD